MQSKRGVDDSPDWPNSGGSYNVTGLGVPSPFKFGRFSLQKNVAAALKAALLRMVADKWCRPPGQFPAGLHFPG